MARINKELVILVGRDRENPRTHREAFCKMKLRNKKTGEITDLSKNGFLKSDNDGHIIVYQEGTLKYYAYNSIAELNEEWEDAEDINVPIIKDEKIRKAVRAWADACTNDSKYLAYDVGYTYFILEADRSDAKITLYVDEHDAIEGLVENEFYTIAELCGEEEE